MDLRGQQSASGRPFAAGYPFTSVVSPRPLFPVVFTDWLSMMAALDVDDPTAASQPRERKTSLYPLPGDVIPPVAEVPPNSAPRGSASEGSGYAATQDVLDAVHDIEQVSGSGMASFRVREATEEPIPSNGYRSNCLPKVSGLSHPRNSRLIPRITRAPYANCHTPSETRSSLAYWFS